MIDLIKFKKFLDVSRKNNGEHLTESSKILYVRNIERFQKKLNHSSIEKTINVMNAILKKNPFPNLKASFKRYILFLGVEKNDERLKDFRQLDRRASALTSERMLSAKIIPDQDIEILLESVNDETKLIIMMLMDTAVRRTELVNISGKDIKYVNDGAIGATIRIFGKGEKYREVYLTHETAELLHRLRVDIEPNQKIFYYKHPDGTPYVRQDKKLYDIIVTASQEYLGYKINLHRFRHSSATKLLNETGNLAGVSSMLGHSTYGVTQIYTKSATSVAKNMYRKLEKK